MKKLTSILCLTCLLAFSVNVAFASHKDNVHKKEVKSKCELEVSKKVAKLFAVNDVAVKPYAISIYVENVYVDTYKVAKTINKSLQIKETLAWNCQNALY